MAMKSASEKLFYKGQKTNPTGLEKIFVCLMVVTIAMLVCVNNYQKIWSRDSYVDTYLSETKVQNSNILKRDVSNLQNSKGSSLGNIDQLKAGEKELMENIGKIIKENPQQQSIQKHVNRKVQVQLIPENDKFADHGPKDKSPIDKINSEHKELPIKENERDPQKLAVKESIIPEVYKNHSKEQEHVEGNILKIPIKSLNKLDSKDENKTSECLPVPKDLDLPKVDEGDCSLPHVIIHDGGQLGNKMCQYISLYLLRQLYGIRVSITQRMKTTLNLFFNDIKLPVQDFKCFTRNTERIMFNDLYTLLNERALKYVRKGEKDPGLNLLKESYYIFHHPCPREVITEYRDFVRSSLVFQGHILRRAKRNIKKALKYLNRSWENSTLITVHVRRKDYTQYILKHYNLTQLDHSYFQRAFNYYREREKNPVFVVVSDDHRWCRETLQTKDVVVAGTKKNPVYDIALLSLGDHHIISYGTFSFMGAILGRGTIVHPVTDNKLYDHYDCVSSNIFKPVSRDPSVT